MITVERWTGREAKLLRQASRRTVRGFAEHLGLSDRTVTEWESKGSEYVPRPDNQAVLDTALARAGADVQARFARLLTTEPSSAAPASAALPPEPATAPQRAASARRQALADRRVLMGLTQEELAEKLTVATSTVRRWEAGTVTPQPGLRSQLAAVLGLEPHQLHAYLAPKTAAGENPAPYANVDTGGPSQSPAPGARDSVFLHPGLEPVLPQRLASSDALHLNNLIDQLEHFDHAAGGRAATRSLALTHLNFAVGCLAKASMTPQARRDWMHVTGRLGRLVGFASADADELPLASAAFTTAESIATEAADHATRINILCGMIRQAVHLGHGPQAAHLLADLQACPPPATSLERCMVHAVEARVYGLLGRDRQALLAIAQAEEAFAEDRTGDEPAWLWYYDRAQLAGDTAHALFPLALDGRHLEDTCARFTQAIGLHLPGNARSRAFSSLKLAVLASKWDQASAARLTDQAITAAAGVSSARADVDLRLLSDHLQGADTEVARRQHTAIQRLLNR